MCVGINDAGKIPHPHFFKKDIPIPHGLRLKVEVDDAFTCPETKAKRSSCNVLTPSVARCIHKTLHFGSEP